MCVVKTLEVYLHRTAQLRGEINSLFITTNEPYKKASRNTIARWIKCVLKLSGIDIDVFKAHSVRSASTSAASKMGLPLKDIMECAGWTSCDTFARFYEKETNTSQNFGLAVVASHEQN